MSAHKYTKFNAFLILKTKRCPHRGLNPNWPISYYLIGFKATVPNLNRQKLAIALSCLQIVIVLPTAINQLLIAQ